MTLQASYYIYGIYTHWNYILYKTILFKETIMVYFVLLEYEAT